MIGQLSSPRATHAVLVVDPDDDVRACLVLYLRMRGMCTVGASGACDTLERLRAGFRPCVVLVDPRRAGLAAWEIVDYLRSDSVLASVPLVLVAREPLLVKSAQWRGIPACVEKPAVPAAFVDAIERQCRRGWLHQRGGPRTAPALVRPTSVPRGASRVAGAGRRG